MKWITKIALWALAGVVFGAATTFTSLFIVQHWADSPPSNLPEYQIYQNEIESNMGITCAELYNKAMTLVENSIAPVVEAGRNGDDWLGMVNDELLQKMKMIHQDASLCSYPMMKSENKRTVYKAKKLREFGILYGLLFETSMSYTGKPLTSDELKPGTFKAIEKIYHRIVENQQKNA